MATAAPVYEERRMSIGRVFQRAFSAITFNPIVVLGLALLVGALPSLLMTYFYVQSGLIQPGVVPTGATFNRLMGTVFVSSLIGFVISALVQAALTRATVSATEGRRVTFGESLATAFRALLPLIGLTILWALGIGLGFVLLLVPGIILLLVWAVAVPALVVERQGIVAAFRRSAELTKGAKWKIFGLLLVLLCVYWLLSLLISAVGLGMYGATSAAGGITIANLIGSVVVSTVFNTLWGTIQPSLYVELREWKEGGSMGSLEEIFA